MDFRSGTDFLSYTGVHPAAFGCRFCSSLYAAVQWTDIGKQRAENDKICIWDGISCDISFAAADAFGGAALFISDVSCYYIDMRRIALSVQCKSGKGNSVDQVVRAVDAKCSACTGIQLDTGCFRSCCIGQGHAWE